MILIAVCLCSVWFSAQGRLKYEFQLLEDRDTVNVNRYDSEGLKTGIWVTDSHYFKEVARYKSGKLNGWKALYTRVSDNEIRSDYLINCKDDKISGTCIVYYDSPVPAFIIVNAGPNVDYLDERIEFMKGEDFEYQGYCYGYNKDGSLRDEGWLIFNDGIADGENVGIWKIYKEDSSYETVDKSERNRKSAEKAQELLRKAKNQ